MSLSQLETPEGEITHHSTLGNATDVTGGDLRGTYAPVPKAGETRMCNDPWTFVQVLGNGQTRPCCFSGVVLGFVSDQTSFAEVFNGEPAQKLRRELLTGDLDEYCKICNMKAVVPLAEFRNEIDHLYKQADKHAAKMANVPAASEEMSVTLSYARDSASHGRAAPKAPSLKSFILQHTSPGLRSQLRQWLPLGLRMRLRRWLLA